LKLPQPVHEPLCSGLAAILGILVAAFPVRAQMQYGEYVWTSYSSFRQIYDIVVGPQQVYLATGGGVLHWDRYKQIWLKPWCIVRGLEESIDLRSAVNVDYLEESNQVAVLTSQGAYLYDPVAQYWTSTDHSFDPPQIADIQAAIFIDLPGQTISGRRYFQQGAGSIMDGELRPHELGAFADDGWGNRWIAVKGVGVLHLDTRMQRGPLWELGFFGNDIRSMSRGEGWFIIAGHNRDKGITFWNRDINLWDHIEPHYTAGFESSWIGDLTVTGRWLLAATDYGLTQVDLKNGASRTWTLFDGLWSNQTLAVAAQKDTVWIGTEDGVNVLYLPRGPIKRLEHPALRNQAGYRIAVDAQALWVGGEMGLFRLDRATGEGNYLGLEGGVGGAVHALHSTSDEMWLGRTTGIEVVDKQHLRQTGYPSQAFFKSATVNAILAKDSLVWVGTDQGLWKFDRARNRWHQYTEIDGLIDNRVTALLMDGDYLLIGTPEGMTRFYWNEEGRID